MSPYWQRTFFSTSLRSITLALRNALKVDWANVRRRACLWVCGSRRRVFCSFTWMQVQKSVMLQG